MGGLTPGRVQLAAMPPLRPALLCALLALSLLACGEANDVLPDPRDGRSGIQVSGQLPDRQVAVSDGLPTVNFGDCDPADGVDRDVCVVTETIQGDLLRITFENPIALQAGAVLPVGSDCRTPEACDEVLDAAVVEVEFGTDGRIRATGGTLRIEVAEPSVRYRGEVSLLLPRGSLSATFDLIERPDELN